MKETTRNYIIKKVQTIYENSRILSDGKTYEEHKGCGVIDILYITLEKAVERLSEKHGYTFDRFF